MKTTLVPALSVCLLASCAGDGGSGDARSDAPTHKDASEDTHGDARADHHDAPRARDGLTDIPDATPSRDAATEAGIARDTADVPDAADTADATDIPAPEDAHDAADAPDAEGARTDAGRPVAIDVPALDVAAVDAPPHDSGPADCARGVELPVVVPEASVRGLSLATNGDRHAVTWMTTSVRAGTSPTTLTWLALLDADGNTLSAPRSVPDSASVVPLTEGFGLVIQGALVLLDRNGVERGTRVTLAPSARSLMREGDRIYWTIAASDGGPDRRVVSLPASGTGPAQETPLVVPAGFVPIAYGPSRVLVATSELTLTTPQRFEEIALDGATVRVRFDQRWSDGPTHVTGAFWDAGTSAWIVAGLRHLPMSREGLAHAWSVSETGVLTPFGSGLRPTSGGLYYWPQGSLTRGPRSDFLALYANASSGGPVAQMRGSVLGAWAASGEFGLNYHSALPATWSDALGRYTVLHGVNGDTTRGPETRLAVRCLR